MIGVAGFRAPRCEPYSPYSIMLNPLTRDREHPRLMDQSQVAGWGVHVYQPGVPVNKWPAMTTFDQAVMQPMTTACAGPTAADTRSVTNWIGAERMSRSHSAVA